MHSTCTQHASDVVHNSVIDGNGMRTPTKKSKKSFEPIQPRTPAQSAVVANAVSRTPEKLHNDSMAARVRGNKDMPIVID